MRRQDGELGNRDSWDWRGGPGFAFPAAGGLGGHRDTMVAASSLLLSFLSLPSQRKTSLTQITPITTPLSRTGCSVTWCLA